MTGCDGAAAGYDCIETGNWLVIIISNHLEVRIYFQTAFCLVNSNISLSTDVIRSLKRFEERIGSIKFAIFSGRGIRVDFIDGLLENHRVQTNLLGELFGCFAFEEASVFYSMLQAEPFSFFPPTVSEPKSRKPCLYPARIKSKQMPE